MYFIPCHRRIICRCFVVFKFSDMLKMYGQSTVLAVTFLCTHGRIKGVYWFVVFWVQIALPLHE